MLPNAAVARTFADHLVLLGGIPADRVHVDPPPGSATINDWITAIDHGDVCELVDGTLVDRITVEWKQAHQSVSFCILPVCLRGVHFGRYATIPAESLTTAEF